MPSITPNPNPERKRRVFQSRAPEMRSIDAHGVPTSSLRRSDHRKEADNAPHARKVAFFATIITACFLALLFLIPACSAPHEIRLSAQSPAQPARLVWWTVEDPQRIHPPIVGVEHRIDATTTRQYVFCDRGVRTFDYAGGNLVRAGRPLPGRGAEPDPIAIRAVLRQLQRAIAADAQRSFADSSPPQLSPIPDHLIAAVESPAGVIALLQDHWSAARTGAPVDLTHRALDAELQHFAHGALELDEASKAF